MTSFSASLPALGHVVSHGEPGGMRPGIGDIADGRPAPCASIWAITPAKSTLGVGTVGAVGAGYGAAAGAPVGQAAAGELVGHTGAESNAGPGHPRGAASRSETPPGGPNPPVDVVGQAGVDAVVGHGVEEKVAKPPRPGGAKPAAAAELGGLAAGAALTAV